MSATDPSDRILDVFHQVVELEPEERAAVLADACGDDEGLRREVETLLEAANASGWGVKRALKQLRPEVGEARELKPVPGEIPDALQAALADHYAIEREIGRGGMATVYVAEDLRHERRVAIKVLRPELAASIGTDRFVREIKLTAGLAHPHILPLHDSGQAGGFLYYVMPYVEGESLRDRLNRAKPLPIDDALQIAREVADALGSAHARGIVHRDIKPENILLEEGHAVVADFGIARAVSAAGGANLTKTIGIVVGSPRYMSPEQAAGGQNLDGRSDLYGLGCVLYEMLAGEPPFTDSSVQEMVSRKLLERFRSVREVCPAVTPEVDSAVTRALAAEPGERFATAGEFAEALGAPGATAPRTASTRRWPVWTAAAALASVFALSWYIGANRLGGPSTDGGGGLSANRVAVFPFTVRGDAELAYLEAGMAELLAKALDGAGQLAPVDSRGLISLAEREPLPRPLDPGSGREIAARFGAGTYVLGDVLAAGGRISVRASLYGVGDEPQTTADAVVASETQVFELVDELARQLLVGSAETAGDELTRIGATTTRSLTALKAYLRGEALFRAGFLNPAGARSAAAEYRQAVAADTAFALAYFRMALLEDYATIPLDIGDATELALRFSDRLPAQERRLLECYAAAFERPHEVEEGERWCREVLARDPNNADALYFLGEASHHFGLRRGSTIAEVRELYDRAIDLEPSQLLGGPWSHRGWIALVEEDFDTWAEYSDSLAQKQLTPSAHTYRLAVDAYRGDEGALVQLIAALGQEASPGIWALETWPLENRSATIQVLRAMTAPDQARARRAEGHLLIAQEELAAGRLSAARAELAEARSLDRDGSLVSAVYLLLSPYLPISADDLRFLRDEVSGWTPAGPARRVWRLYLLGLLSERLGDLAGAERFASELVAYAATEPAEERAYPAGALADDLALYLRARLTAGAGRYEDAWRLLQETTPERWWDDLDFVRPHEKQLYERWLTAEVLVALDRPQDALNWLAGMGMEGERSYMGIRHFRMAEIFGELGDREMATYHYGRFITYWKDADPELQPRVEAARQAIEALSAEG